MTQTGEGREERKVRSAGMTAQERAEALDRTQWAHELSWRQIELMTSFMEALRAPRGCELCTEGEEPSFMGIVLQGTLDVLKEGSDGTRQVVNRVRPRQSFGEMSLIDGQPRSATLAVSQDCMFLMLTRQDFYRLLDEHPGLGVRLLLKLGNLMSQRLRQTSGALAEALGRRADERDTP